MVRIKYNLYNNKYYVKTIQQFLTEQNVGFKHVIDKTSFSHLETPRNIKFNQQENKFITPSNTANKKYIKAAYGDDYDIRKLGQGTTASVYSLHKNIKDKELRHEPDAHSVVRISKHRTQISVGHHSTDAHLKFAQEASKQTGNPHLPRIESVHSFQHKDGWVHVTKMEKLTPLHDLSDEERQSLHRSIKGKNNIRKSKFSDNDWVAETAESHMMNGRKTDNQHLKQAGKIVQKVVDSGGGHPDMHSGNFMTRRTPFGHQLVVTDPLV